MQQQDGMALQNLDSWGLELHGYKHNEQLKSISNKDYC